MSDESIVGRCIYKFHADFDGAGGIDSVFLARPEDVAAAMGRRAYFDGVLSKHSSACCDLSAENITMVSDNPEAVRVVAELGLSSGHNPLDYLNARRDRLRAAVRKIRSPEEVDRDLVWYCTGCGDHGRADPEDKLGDKSGCLVCHKAWSVVMTTKDVANFEKERARKVMDNHRKAQENERASNEKILHDAAEALAPLTVGKLDVETMGGAWYALRAACLAAHQKHAKRGGIAMRAFCACGHTSMGNGDDGRCEKLRRLSDGGLDDETAWLDLARELLAECKVALGAAQGDGR